MRTAAPAIVTCLDGCQNKLPLIIRYDGGKSETAFGECAHLQTLPVQCASGPVTGDAQRWQEPGHFYLLQRMAGP